MQSCLVMPAPEDEDLVRRWRRGEEEAFSQLYHRYRRPVLSTAYRIIGNPEEAQDATQEIFLKVYRFLPDWDPKRSRLSTWLYRLASNHAIDRWRVQRRRNRVESRTDVTEWAAARKMIADPDGGPYSILIRKEFTDRLRGYVMSLPKLQRRFFVLRYFQGLRLEEIALVEGRSIGTVKGLLFRACRTIRVRFRSS